MTLNNNDRLGIAVGIAVVAVLVVLVVVVWPQSEPRTDPSMSLVEPAPLNPPRVLPAAGEIYKWCQANGKPDKAPDLPLSEEGRLSPIFDLAAEHFGITRTEALWLYEHSYVPPTPREELPTPRQVYTFCQATWDSFERAGTPLSEEPDSLVFGMAAKHFGITRAQALRLYKEFRY